MNRIYAHICVKGIERLYFSPPYHTCTEDMDNSYQKEIGTYEIAQALYRPRTTW